MNEKGKGHDHGSCASGTCMHQHHDQETHNHTHVHNQVNCTEEDCNQEMDDEGRTKIEQAKYKFKITGLDCASCAAKIETKLNQESYIKEAHVHFTSSMVQVNPAGRIKKDALLEKMNLLVDKVEPGSKIVDEEEVIEESNRGGVIKLIIGLLIFGAAIGLEDVIPIPAFFLYLVPYIFIGYPVLLKSARNIMRGDIFDENFLMSVATIGAFAIGEYKEGIAVMLFYSVGELFQSYAVNRSRRSIADLMDIKSDYANLLVDGIEKRVDPKALIVRDIIAIKAGEKVPVDGTIIEGDSSLDVSALSGEAALKDVGAQDQILAGSINTNGLLKMRVEKIFADSTVAKILELVENAANKKSPIENFITKFAKIYTPIVVGLAILLVFVPSFIFGFDEFNDWLYRGLTFLVVSCPCALVVSVPLGVFAGIGSASRIGALVKGGSYLEKLNDVNCVIFDKTGTITKGNFQVDKIVGSQELLEVAAYGEAYSNHPIAKSIVDAYAKPINFERMSEYEELAGFGIKVLLDKKLLVVGNIRLMEAENVIFREVEALGTIIHVAYDKKYLGYITIDDEIKASSEIAMRELDALGIHDRIMLTGDRQAVADKIAKEVGIQRVHAQLLPQDKVSVLETYLNDPTKTVAFVGDGINDAPALMRADIGISMGGIGSDVAIEASDVVLMNDDLSLIPKTIRISRITKKILKQNIIFSIGVKVIVLILTVFGLTNMWMGVFADVGVTLLAILNSMRVLTSYKRM